MKLALLSVLVLVGCASRSEKKHTEAPTTITAESFKKEKAVAASEVRDFYSTDLKGQSPALQDETLDRYTAEELANLAESKDPLFEISLRCSKKDFSAAFAAASSAYNKYHKTPVYWNLVANCHLQQGNQRKALLFYNKALEVTPNYVPALNNIGVLYSRQGEDQKALVAFERANKQSRFSKTPRYNLAKLYLRYGLAESALPLFQGLLSESSEDVDLLNSVAQASFILADYQSALTHYSRIPKSFWSQPEVGLNLALTLKKLGRTADSLAVLNSIKSPSGRELKDYYNVVSQQLGAQE